MKLSELKKHLSYNPETGDFTRVWSWNKPSFVGRLAGFKRGGYIVIKIEAKRYSAHRLAWLYMTGEHPALHIDHINGIGTDNRFCNLRLATPALNSRNQKTRSNNICGLKGVRQIESGMWMARISPEKGERLYLGLYKTKEEAAAAYDRAAIEFFGEFARTNILSGPR